MLEILQLYISGFWAWLGLTIGLAIVCSSLENVVTGLFNGLGLLLAALLKQRLKPARSSELPNPKAMPENTPTPKPKR